MPFAVTTRLLGYLSGGLGLVALSAGAFAGLQTFRLDAAQAQVATLGKALEAEKGRADLSTTVANERTTALRTRDETIAQQSASIDAIRAQASAERTQYLAGIRKADGSAKANEARAAELVRTVTVPDDRCAAARTLIEQEMLSVH